MKMKTALILLTTLSTAFAYTCYVCGPTDSQPCTRTMNCMSSNITNRCYKSNILGLITQGCMSSQLCVGPIKCCDGDLCNSAHFSAPSVLLLGLMSAILALFL